MSKRTRMFGKGIATMFFLFIASNNVWASEYYRDCDVKVNSPSTAQGLVYVDVDTKRPTNAYFYHSSSPGQTAQIKANFSGNNYYWCKFFAYPKPGYAVAGFVTKEDYLAGRKSKFINRDGAITKNGDAYRIATSVESEKVSDPVNNGSSYRYSAKTTVEYYAIFKPSTNATVRVMTPGGLKHALSQTGKGEDISDIIVIGSINDQDIAYLRRLVNNNNLTRIDLSAARISTIPDNAFSYCHSLYEIKLPTSGLSSIGKEAFAYCHVLKRVSIPSSVTYQGVDVFKDCYSISRGF